jgi:ABC-type Fe3+ transport system substrate-binding protein
VQRLIAAAAAANERELVLSWTLNNYGGGEGAERFGELFNQMYGTQVTFKFAPGPSVSEGPPRLAQELAAGQPAFSDVINTNTAVLGQYLNQPLAEPYDYTQLSPRITPKMTLPNGMGVETLVLGNCVYYNTNAIQEKDVPRTLKEAVDPKWNGRMATTTLTAQWIVYKSGWTVDEMRANVTALAKAAAGVVRPSGVDTIINGQYDFMYVGNGHDEMRKATAKGAPLGCAVPQDIGPIQNPQVFFVPKNATHPNLAKLWINTVVSEPGQRLLYEIVAGDHPDLPGSQSASDWDPKVPALKIDVEFARRITPAQNELVAEFRKTLEGR